MKVLRSFAALFVLSGLVIAPPWIILHWGAWAELNELIHHPSLLLLPDDGHIVMAVLTALGAVCWVVLVWGIALETFDFLRYRVRSRRSQPHRVRTLRLIRALLRPLIAAAFGLSLLGSTLHASAEEPSAIPAITAPEKVTPLTEGTPEAEGEVYVVQPGDSLWSIAEKLYGDGQMWTRIAGENEDLLHGVSDLIHVGWKLRIPEIHQSEPSSLPVEKVIVSPGDSLWSIAETELGSGDQWPAIAELNQSLISDPAIIEPGWTLILPGTETDSEVSEPHDDQSGEDDAAPPSRHDNLPPIDELQLPADASDQPEEPTGEVILVTDSDKPAFPSTAVGISAMLASGMVFMVGKRRLGQLHARPVGRRILHMDEEGQAFETALDVIGSQAPASQVSTRLDSLMAETQHLDAPLGALAQADVDLLDNLERDLPEIEENGIALCLGEDDKGNLAFIDVDSPEPFLVFCDQSDLVTHVMQGIAMTQAMEECRAFTELHIISSGTLFDSFDSLERHTTFEEGLNHLKLMVADRRTFKGDSQWSDLRRDPNCGEAWRPILYFFIDPLSRAEFTQLSACVDGPSIGVAVIASMVCADPGHADELAPRWLQVRSGDEAIMSGSQHCVKPHLLKSSKPLFDLLETTASLATTPAWWSVPQATSGDCGDELPNLLCAADAQNLEREHDMLLVPPASEDPATALTLFSYPTLKLLGPIAMEGVTGIPPTRAERACMEYCGWLLENPGTTALAMTQGLMVAEGTRRSNMSRLRSWLGNDAEGNPYLPEAYSGRIWLDIAVTSDWQRMGLLIAGGLNETPTDKLIQALSLVRGAPLADAAPGQWHWAEELRTDMVCVIRDLGVVVTNRCLDDGDIEQARWACGRALLAAPEDETLMCARLRVEHAAGNRMEVERLVSWISRNARNLGIDLLPETLDTLQDVLAMPAHPGGRNH
ncbi:MAG: LysM peptidoglycan-binding domain-containing protein [Propionibacteriaceae bacterium]|nr:LysM peptidoglycan-binding domain-containing protein [Propionibacteriaceae bacterium]